MTNDSNRIQKRFSFKTNFVAGFPDVRSSVGFDVRKSSFELKKRERIVVSDTQIAFIYTSIPLFTLYGETSTGIPSEALL